MNLERYVYFADNNYKNYEFYSIGPKGQIIMAIIIFMPQAAQPPRTRLYQIGIAGLLTEINKDFEVYGFVNGKWQIFQKNVNYEAFLVKRK